MKNAYSIGSSSSTGENSYAGVGVGKALQPFGCKGVERPRGVAPCLRNNHLRRTKLGAKAYRNFVVK